MTPGAYVQIKDGWRCSYRRAGAERVGVLDTFSPNGSVARVKLGGDAAAYVRVEHLEYASLDDGPFFH